MKRTSILILIFVVVVSCKQKKEGKEQIATEKTKFTEIIKEDYELYKPNKEINGVLILFGGYPENADDIKREFQILDIARENSIAVLLSNFNQKLWLEESEKRQLAKKLQNIIIENQLPTENIFIGGFSSGGVVSLLISNFIVGMKQFYIDPKGVFIVDSPIDLVALYKSSEKNIKRNFSEPSIQESTWLLETLGSNFGNPKDNIGKYEKNAVFTYSTNNTSNIKKLKRTKIRLYTEPDTLWWKENRMADYEQMNAFYIKKLSESLNKKGYKSVEYIPTTNKGYRANGERHPHSWAIVDKTELINWILNK
ncbi:hypothetical protein LCL86_11660 [Muricauda ruestringensis]|uniref:hypothetical protein n=1 Tax=Flagellimonas ruestringensis TaxID=111501 RepID=UPI001CD36169|nr:hypothetical protein [Allomuricauda ruestringensis]MCA0959705.1 hypothetical protein [Allomuricauda ruestringensis]